jgi:hypothetical protein
MVMNASSYFEVLEWLGHVTDNDLREGVTKVSPQQPDEKHEEPCIDANHCAEVINLRFGAAAGEGGRFIAISRTSF